MKQRLVALFVLSLIGFATAGLGANKLSKISAYAGKYSGSVILSGNGNFFPGSATARFVASKKKENGTLTINSTVVISGNTAFFTETYKFNKHTVLYTFTQSFGPGFVTGTGAGSASLSKKTITYQAPLVVNATTFTSTGTIKLAKKSLLVNDTLSGSNFSFAYNLKRKK